jgi:hypothetical protein
MMTPTNPSPSPLTTFGERIVRRTLVAVELIGERL